MRIELRADHASDEAPAKSAIGRSLLGEWFALPDERGGAWNGPERLRPAETNEESLP